METCPTCTYTLEEEMAKLSTDIRTNWVCGNAECANEPFQYGTVKNCRRCGWSRGRILKQAMRQAQDMALNAISVPEHFRGGWRGCLMTTRKHTLMAWMLASGQDHLAHTSKQLLNASKFKGVKYDDLIQEQKMTLSEQLSVMNHFALDYKTSIEKVRDYNSMVDNIVSLVKPAHKYPGRFKQLYYGMSPMIPGVVRRIMDLDKNTPVYTAIYMAIVLVYGSSDSHDLPFKEAAKGVRDQIRYGSRDIPFTMKEEEGSADRVLEALQRYQESLYESYKTPEYVPENN